jgi:hypothetical protein
MSDGGCEFSLAPSFLERALSACSLAGLGGDNRSGLNILATSPADDGNLAPTTTHQPNHVARSRSFAAANSNLSLPGIADCGELLAGKIFQRNIWFFIDRIFP